LFIFVVLNTHILVNLSQRQLEMPHSPTPTSQPSQDSSPDNLTPSTDTHASHESISGVSGTNTQFMLNKEEIAYLQEQIPDYIANNNHGEKQKKGSKGQWVINNVLPDFKTCFNYLSVNVNGPRMDEITKVCLTFLSLPLSGY
jgi:hypothetical protein